MGLWNGKVLEGVEFFAADIAATLGMHRMRRFMRHEVLYSNEVYELDSAPPAEVWVDDLDRPGK